MADWSKITSRGNVQDRRGYGGVALGGGGLVMFAVVMLLNYLNTGEIPIDQVLNELQNAQVQSASAFNAQDFEGADSYEVFASTVLGSANDMWSKLFAESGATYTEPRLVLFRSATESGCGTADSRVGPHYCPLDETIYLDETFFDELKKLGAEGDVAQAYVIAHEVGHHVQNLLGTLDLDSESNSIPIELQADCYAGLWAYSIKDLNVFEPNEVHEAMNAAAAVGDDRIQSAYTGRINPETWTHGSSAQRLQSFDAGYEAGAMSACS